MSDVNYEVVRVDVFSLLDTGADDPAGAWLTVPLPQEVDFAPSIEKGAEVKERAAGILAVNIKERDSLTGGTVMFRGLEIDAETLEAMCGGDVLYDTDSPPAIIGWDDPMSDDVPPYFKMRVYSERYVDDNLSGYRKVTLAKCEANVPKYNLGQQKIAIPEMDITCMENANATGGAAPWRSIEAVAALGS